MNDILLTNIFFIITGTAVLIITALLGVVLFHAIKIIRTVRKILEKIDAGSETIADDLSRLREYFIERSFFSMILGKVFGATRGVRRKKSTRTKNEKKESVALETSE